VACDCDELANRLRQYDERLRRLERGSNGASSGGGGGDSDLIERVFKHKKWLLMEKILTMIYQGNKR
jgi:hypothetical protein